MERIFVALVVLIICGCSYKPDIPHAKIYEVLKSEECNVPDRTRQDFWIYSGQAKSDDEKAQTTMKAAVELSNKYNLNVARVFLELNKSKAGKGNAVVSAVYASDSQGFSGVEKTRWEVMLMDENGYRPYPVNE